MKLTSVFVAALTGVSVVAIDKEWQMHTANIAPVIKDKTVACGSSCIHESVKQGVIDIFNQIEGGEDTGSVVKNGDGHEIIFNYRKNAPNGFLKPNDAQASELANGISVAPNQHPRQGCTTVIHTKNRQVDFSFTINSQDHSFTSTPPACAGIK